MKGFRAESTPMTTTLPDHENEPNSLGSLLSQHCTHSPGLPLLLLGKGIAVSDSFKAEICKLLEHAQEANPGPVVLTVLSNAVPDLNPFAGLANAPIEVPDSAQLADVVNLLAPGEISEWNNWPDHCILVSAKAAQALSATDTRSGNALLRLQEAGGKLLLADSIFLHDPLSELYQSEKLQPHERRRPAAWGLLRERLGNWIQLQDSPHPVDWAPLAADFRKANKPVTLHITHSWGGGVAKWIESFIEADDHGINFQLCAEGPQSNKGYGQRLSLYLGNQLETPVARWWLQPPIQSTVKEHSQYRAVLQDIQNRYGIGRVMISSLIGHSLEALSTGLPTLQVLHDFYPLWPLLGIHPGHYPGNTPAERLTKALQKNELLPGFRDRDATGWQLLGQQWRECIQNNNVRTVAPSQSVADLLGDLDSCWSGLDTQIIPHGLPELPGNTPVLPKDREDGRLRLVIPGRIQAGKGQQLLLEALPEITRFAHIYLLGAGKEGEVFFGRSGVDVITQYRREDLRDLLATIGPHVAGLLSIVPETFSYTLSEMQQLGIPVIATRVGSLAERVKQDENGWLIEPDAGSLARKLQALAANRSEITAVRERLADLSLSGTTEMVGEYEALCAPLSATRELTTAQNPELAQTAALAYQKTELTTENRQLAGQAKELQIEVEKRSSWAEDREKARVEEVERRIKWVAQLEEQLEHEQAAHRQTNQHLEDLREVHTWVLATASWRWTRPFRVLGRVFKNLKQARAFNPLRWPLLLSQLVRTLSTDGLRGALERSQLSQAKHHKPEIPAAADIESIGNPEAPAGFPEVDQPEVSIIIPVYNKWLYTAACLRSLAEIACKASFEVIVVDDQSSDETPARLEQVKGLLNLRNEQNLGFVGSCNRGAEAARGRYVVMLNNDTQVLEGWLDALLDTFSRHPDTGMAGASLVYPDGTLQEAGGIIFRDGSGWNYGKGDNPERPEYHYSREVDYCSGACIMLEAALFRELGGFDPHYAPAYYEDTDLAFRIRSKGLKVRLQPMAVIVHHEGITSGTDINEGAKRYQAVNREKFLERWDAELASYPEPIHDPDNGSEVRRARDHRLRGRVLIIDAYTPEPDQDSGSVRLCYLMDCLAELGYGVTFMADNRTHAGRYTTALQQAGVEVVYDPWTESLPVFFRERGSDFDFVLISRHYIAANYVSQLRRYCPRARFIFDTVDLHYLREERMAELENSQALKTSAAQTRRSELAVINAADATLVVSPVEKAVLAESAPGAKVHVISNIHEVTGSKRPFTERKDIFFVGGYQHPPNIDAALWFVSEIWPLIHEQEPGMTFHLIGSKAPEQIRALHGNGVHFHGFVKTLDPWLDGCRLAVAPLRYGAGVKGKVNMSMSRGQPVVATPMAVEGMFAKPGRDVIVAETAQDFADGVIRIYRDENLWNNVSLAGLENVRQYFSLETARLGLQALLHSLR